MSAFRLKSQNEMTMHMQNLRTLKVSITPLIMGSNDEIWRLSVLNASGILSADYILQGKHYCMTHEKWNSYRSDISKSDETTVEQTPLREEPSQVRPRRVDSPWTGFIRTPEGSIADEADPQEQEEEELEVEERPVQLAAAGDSTVHSAVQELLAAKTKKTAEARTFQMYSDKLLEQGLKNRRVFVILGEDKSLTLESPLDSLRRTLLSDAVRKSMSKYPHLLKEVGEGDVAGMWAIVAQTEQPEPYVLVVSALNRLTLHKKTSSVDIRLGCWDLTTFCSLSRL